MGYRFEHKVGLVSFLEKRTIFFKGGGSRRLSVRCYAEYSSNFAIYFHAFRIKIVMGKVWWGLRALR